MITIINKHGKYTGTQYGEISKEALDWHVSQGDTWIDLPKFELDFIEGEEPDYGAPAAIELLSITSREAKAAKQLALNSITVTVNGKVFDGRAKDQVNIMAAIQAATLLNITETEWVMSDNVPTLVTLDELKQALVLSIQKVGEIVKGLV